MISAKYLGLTANQLAKIASELDTEKESLCARIDELCIENEKLRAEVERLIHAQDIGTCHEVEDDDTGFIVCSECGAVHDTDYTNYYCWCCGRKVVD